MKYSIFIHPKAQNHGNAMHAIHFIKALLDKKHHIIGVFFYGHAVKNAFKHCDHWHTISQQGVPLIACSNIAEDYLAKKFTVLNYVQLAGLGQWMDAHLSADKRIEFV